MQNVLEIRDAHKSFGATTALDGAAVYLRPGEQLALLGPNGAGKTTLIRSVAGLARLDRGDVTLLGQRMQPGADPQTRTQLGVVPQELAIYDALTARENLSIFGKLHGVPDSELASRIDWTLDWTGLRDRATEPTRNFSGGMKRRLNIACGVLHKPTVILLDEPTVGVDPQSRQRIWEMCAELKRGGASLLLTTHQLDEAQQVCDRITIIDHGRTIADGTLAELVARTIGAQRRVTFEFAQAPAAGRLTGDPTIEGHRASWRIADVAAELPALLTQCGTAGLRVDDIHVEPPSLQAVFLHLTGRELRE